MFSEASQKENETHTQCLFFYEFSARGRAAFQFPLVDNYLSTNKSIYFFLMADKTLDR